MAATIQDLFPELLVKIFKHFIRSEGHMKFSRNVVPVCTTWRNLSWTPELWKSIHALNRDNSHYLKYLMGLSYRGLLCNTKSLNISEARLVSELDNSSDFYDKDSAPLDPNHLLVVLSNIRDLKALEISHDYVDENTIMIIAKFCPNLERLRMEYVRRAVDVPTPPKEMNPILTICGPKLKHLHLYYDPCIEDGEQIISEIIANCMSLEVFEWAGFKEFTKFPINELMRGCPRLRELKLENCEFVTAGEDDCTGFDDLTVFDTFNCDFHGLDVGSLLKNSNNLEHLELENFRHGFFDPSTIPSNKIKSLGISYEDDDDVNLVILEQAVYKWRHTLLDLSIMQRECDITSVLKNYLRDNQRPKLEVLAFCPEGIDRSFLKMFIQTCQNLKKLHDVTNVHTNREVVMKYGDSL